MNFILDLDTAATHARYVTGIELMAGFIAAGNTIPLQRFVDGRLIFEEPNEVCAGGLIRITIATGLKTFKLAFNSHLAICWHTVFGSANKPS